MASEQGMKKKRREINERKKGGGRATNVPWLLNSERLEELWMLDQQFNHLRETRPRAVRHARTRIAVRVSTADRQMNGTGPAHRAVGVAPAVPTSLISLICLSG